MASIRVIKKGFYTTIQDRGRKGYAAMGIPESGAMDQHALQLAHLLLNNPKDAASLECTLVGPTILFDTAVAFVLTGAQAQATLDQEPIAMNQVYLAKNGQILTIGKISNGCRTYLGIDGGIDSSVHFGSRSMYHPITKAATISDSMQLDLGIPSYGQSKGGKVHIENNTISVTRPEIQVYKGPEFHLLDKAASQAVESLEFKIASWDRMGIRMDGDLAPQKHSLLTSPVIPGTVQLTPSGNLFVLMRDCQTTGGYPRVLQLSPNAINAMAQKQTGHTAILSVL